MSGTRSVDSIFTRKREVQSSGSRHDHDARVCRCTSKHYLIHGTCYPTTTPNPPLSCRGYLPGVPKTRRMANRKPKASTPAPSKMPVRRSQDDFFKARDRNQDGSITLEEFIGNPKGRNVPVLTTRFAKLDANSDGKLTLQELKSSP